MGLILGGASASDLILDGQSVSLYVGGNPPTKVWPTGPRVVTISTTRNEWNVGSQSGDVSMIQALAGTRHLVFSVPVTCDRTINAGSAGTITAGNRLEAGWVLAPPAFSNLLYTFTEII